jgi:predicted transcriptional regulator
MKKSGPEKGKPGYKKHKSPTDLEATLQRVAEMDRRGYSQYEIAREVGVRQPTVSEYLKKIRKRYVESMLEDRKEMVAEKLEQYREVRRVAWEAYMRSLDPATKRVVERMPEMKAAKRSPRGGRRTREETNLEGVRAQLKVIKVIVTTEGRLPANEFLHTVLKTLDAERELLGLDPDRRSLVGVYQVPWEQLYGADASPDLVEQEIEGVLALPPPVKEVGGSGSNGTNGKHN